MECTLLDTVRSFKILDIAVFDFVGTLLVAFLLLNWFVKSPSILQYILVGIISIALGVVVHIILDIPTRLNYMLGISEEPIRKNC